MKYIGIIGTRERDTEEDYLAIEAAFLEAYEHGDIIVSGGCAKGGDRFAEILSKAYDIEPIIFFPDKSKIDRTLASKNYRAAYAQIAFSRNTKIAEKSDILIACVAPARSGGTEDTIRKFEKLNPGKKAILV